MTYSDLIEFDPIESVVELRSANEHDRAEGLVRNYVISEAMADRLVEVVFPQLQFERPVDNKGLMVVGNYGTGKSHLMAVISAVAEHEDVVGALRSERVAAAAGEVAGRFKVVRTELGSTKMDFREFVVRQLESALAGWGVDYQFPAYDQVGNHKPAFEAMMAAFGEAYPDHGLLLVVDELLDYFRTRKGQQLTLDLNFLREIGEICRESRFRFVAGLQEMLFENPTFEFAASAVQRVKDRFEQVLIAKRDVKFVVAERLLHKTPEQKRLVREYLTPFAPFYGRMNERLDEYVQLFPVHPDYVDAFEQIHFVEQRQVLKTLSQEMRSVARDTVPTDHPGLIAYDSYWEHVAQNPALRTHPDVGEVIEVNGVLRSRVEQAFTRPAYAPMAMRIVNGLSVHRLTTRDVHAPIGATAEELRDSLCLYDPAVSDLGGDPADDLLSQVEAVLQEVVKTVSGQFISYNRDNRQYFLDLKKTEDFDAIIDRRVETMGNEDLDRAYYDAVRQVLGRTDTPTHRSLPDIWEHEVPWLDRRSGRDGYLFFGTPAERNTAIPPGEFYLYFIQPYDAPAFSDEKRSDEVFFRLAKRDDAFETALRRYAAATALASSASAHARAIYRKKAGDSLRDITSWLSEHLMTAFDVTHQGRTKNVPGWLKGVNMREALGFGPNQASSRETIAEQINVTAAAALASHFAARAPEYPTFSIQVTKRSREQAAADALRAVRGARPTKQATAVLDALELLDVDRVAPGESRYAQYVVDLLEAKGHGQVLNRSEIVERDNGVDYVAPNRFRLEPEWLMVVIGALVYNGDVVLAVPGRKFTATDVDALASTPVGDLAAFKHIERPKGWNVPGLRSLLDLVGLPPGQVTALVQGAEAPVRELQSRVDALTDRTVDALQKLHRGLSLWGKSLLTDAEAQAHQERLGAARTFFESVQRFDTPGKLKNFNVAAVEIDRHHAGVRALGDVERLVKLADELGPLASYLALAETVLPDDHAWVKAMRPLRSDVLAALEDPAAREDSALAGRLKAQLERSKSDYASAYHELLRKARLDLAGDKRKAQILNGPRIKALDALRSLDILPTGQLEQVKGAVASLKSASTPGPEDLRHQPTFEGFQPSREGAEASATARLDALDAQVDRMVDGWTLTLLEALDQSGTEKKLSLLGADVRARVETFRETKALPEPVGSEFVAALREALSDLRGVTVNRETLTKKLFEGGTPATPAQLQERLAAYLVELVGSGSGDKVRLLLEG